MAETWRTRQALEAATGPSPSVNLQLQSSHINLVSASGATHVLALDADGSPVKKAAAPALDATGHTEHLPMHGNVSPNQAEA